MYEFNCALSQLWTSSGVMERPTFQSKYFPAGATHKRQDCDPRPRVQGSAPPSVDHNGACQISRVRLTASMALSRGSSASGIRLIVCWLSKIAIPVKSFGLLRILERTTITLGRARRSTSGAAHSTNALDKIMAPLPETQKSFKKLPSFGWPANPESLEMIRTAMEVALIER